MLPPYVGAGFFFRQVLSRALCLSSFFPPPSLSLSVFFFWSTHLGQHWRVPRLPPLWLAETDKQPFCLPDPLCGGQTDDVLKEIRKRWAGKNSTVVFATERDRMWCEECLFVSKWHASTFFLKPQMISISVGGYYVCIFINDILTLIFLFKRLLSYSTICMCAVQMKPKIQKWFCHQMVALVSHTPDSTLTV